MKYLTTLYAQKTKLETLKLEKDGVYGKLAGLLKASKDLDNLIESQRSEKNKDGFGYSAVPPPLAQLYLSPKKDLSWTGLPECADDTVTDYSRPSPTVESTSGDDQNKSSSASENGESTDSILSKPAIKDYSRLDDHFDKESPKAREELKERTPKVNRGKSRSGIAWVPKKRLLSVTITLIFKAEDSSFFSAVENHFQFTLLSLFIHIKKWINNIPPLPKYQSWIQENSSNGSSGYNNIFNMSIMRCRSGSQIKFKDINQIDEDDIEEMDIKWNMALLSMRADKAPRTQDRGRRDNYRQGSKAEEQAPKALMAIDGVGWDWNSLGKFEGKVDEGFLIGYSINSKAFRVFNSRTCFQDKFDAEKAREEVDQQYMLFPVWSSGSTYPRNNEEDVIFDVKEHDFDAKNPESEVNVSPRSSAQSRKQDDKTKKEAKGKSPVESFT
nr:hypothetical protein [Tanacetum cinerariifolium]